MAKKPKKRKIFQLKLTQLELVHLRDLLTVSLPTDMQVTVSQALAAAEERPLVETKLWQKVAKASAEANIPLDEEAPDFIVAPVGLPSISVFRVADNLGQMSGEAPEEDEVEDVVGLIEGLRATVDASEETPEEE
jgi:hypothetical protein